MIIGSGLIANGLSDVYGIIQYAAGVSNSKCADPEEFDRDKQRLKKALGSGLIVYFSTCSEEDTPYVKHKRECEELVSKHEHLICRLPIVAGKTPNPHTLLNYLYSRIARSERFDLYPDARRNIIDIIDVGTIVRWLMKKQARGIVNVAAPMDYSMHEIVVAFEQHLKKSALVRLHEGGSRDYIDTTYIEDAPVDWSGDYLKQILWKRYR